MSDQPDSKLPDFGTPRYFLAPWRAGFYGGLLITPFALVYGMFSTFDTIDLGPVPKFSPAYLLVTASIVTLSWSIAGMVSRNRYGHARESAAGAGLSFFSLLISAVAGYAHLTQ